MTTSKKADPKSLAEVRRAAEIILPARFRDVLIVQTPTEVRFVVTVKTFQLGGIQ